MSDLGDIIGVIPRLIPYASDIKDAFAEFEAIADDPAVLAAVAEAQKLMADPKVKAAIATVLKIEAILKQAQAQPQVPVADRGSIESQ